MTTDPKETPLDEAHTGSAAWSLSVVNPGEQPQGDLLQRQRAIVAMGRRAIAPPSLDILVQDAAALVAETLGAEYSGACEISPDGNWLRTRLAPTQPHGAELETQVWDISAEGSQSLAGYALQVAQPVVVADLPKEDSFMDMFLRERGIKSAVAVPLKLHDRSFGALIACSSRGQHFDDRDALFAETIAHLVANTIGRKRAEKSLASERRRTAEVLQTVKAVVLALDPQWHVVSINGTGERVTGFSLSEIQDDLFWNVFAVPEEVDQFCRLPEVLQHSASPVEHESYLLTKHAKRRRIAWTFSKIGGDGQKPDSIIATGIDVTGQRDAEKKAQDAETAVEQLRRVVTEMESAGANAARYYTETAGAFAEVLDGNMDRRRLARRVYPYRQQIAPMIDGNLPKPDEFEEVEFRDISAGGLSFYCPTPPTSDTLVAALGIPPKITYLVAQVAHITRVERNGQRSFVVGCNCLDRASYDAGEYTEGLP